MPDMCLARCMWVISCIMFDRGSGSVPLGEALMDTAVEVRDESGHLVTDGEGQVFIGNTNQLSVHLSTLYRACPTESLPSHH